MHALFKIRKHLDFHKLTPKLAMIENLWWHSLTPILLYKSEVWGVYANNDFFKWPQQKKKHLKFSKIYLGVNRKASDIASRGELGKLPLLISIFQRLFSYIKVPMSQNFFYIWVEDKKLVNRFFNIFRFSLFIREICGSKPWKIGF
jgi:hypothetical protein